MEIWINPACSKCQVATAALDEAGIEYTVRRYLDDPPTKLELIAVLQRLGLEPWDITRTQEDVAKEIGLSEIPKDDENRDRWIEALAEHPILIQRPILTADDGTTVVGRDADSLRRVVRPLSGPGDTGA
jgi:arsenate reductase (glutaredoxin)